MGLDCTENGSLKGWI